MSLLHVALASRRLIMRLRSMMRWGSFACTIGILVFHMWISIEPLSGMNPSNIIPDNSLEGALKVKPSLLSCHFLFFFFLMLYISPYLGSR